MRTLLLEEDKTPSGKSKKHVIRGTCPVCGCVPGVVNRNLTYEERCALIDAGYEMREAPGGHDIASFGKEHQFSGALFVYCKLEHPKPKWKRMNAFERASDEDWLP